MTETTTVTVRMNQSLKADLDLLAKHTNRSKSYLAAEAISGFVARELALAEGIERAREDFKAGRVVEHEEAMARIKAVIDRVKAQKKARREASGT